VVDKSTNYECAELAVADVFFQNGRSTIYRPQYLTFGGQERHKAR